MPPLFAFGWINLPMLGWLAAAAAPILIHLWSRRKYREMSWAAMEYLLAAVRRQTRRLLFEQWLLLAVRTLLVVLVVLAVAEPYAEQAGLAFTPGGHAHRVLVLDGSYSMAYKPTDKTRFERAKELARQIVEESPQGDAFTLVLMSSPPRVVVGTPALEPSDDRRARSTTCSFRTPRPTCRPPSRRSGRSSTTRRRENPRLARHEVYFLTDLQRVTWAPKLSEAAAAEFLQQTDELAQTADAVRDRPGPADGREPGGHRPPRGRSADDRRPQRATGGRAEELRPPGPQPSAGRIAGRRPADRAEGSRHRRRADGRRSSFRIGSTRRAIMPSRSAPPATPWTSTITVSWPCRCGRRSACCASTGGRRARPFHGAADYLAVALAPQGQQADRAPVQAEVAAESALLERNLTRLRLRVSLQRGPVHRQRGPRAGRLSPRRRQPGLLSRRSGVGRPLQPRVGRSGAGQGRGAATSCPPNSAPLVDQPQFRLDPLGYRHPIVQAFRGRGEASLLTTPVFKYYKLALPEDSPGENRAGHWPTAIRWWSRSRSAAGAWCWWPPRPIRRGPPCRSGRVSCRWCRRSWPGAPAGQLAAAEPDGGRAAGGCRWPSAAAGAADVSSRPTAAATRCKLRAAGDYSVAELRRHDAERHLHGAVRPAGQPQPDLRRQRGHGRERPDADRRRGIAERGVAGRSASCIRPRGRTSARPRPAARSSAEAACTSICSTPCWACCCWKRFWAGSWDIMNAEAMNERNVTITELLPRGSSESTETLTSEPYGQHRSKLDRTPARHPHRGRRGHGLGHRVRLALAALADAAVCGALPWSSWWRSICAKAAAARAAIG